MTPLAEALSALLGPAAVRAGEAVATLDPGWHTDNLGAGLVVSPASTAEVSQLLAWCNARGVGVVPQGGRTGLAGGAVSRPGEVVLSLTRMNRILRLDPAGGFAVVEAGATIAALQAAAAAHGLDPGIDLGSRDSATLGGMISTNAGGIRAFRHGVMRHRILGLEAVIADGTVMSDMTTVLKASTGPDVKQLFCGSEGTLGVVTRAVLRLEPAPGPRATALIGTATAAGALAAARRFLGPEAGGMLLAAELMTGGYADASARAHGLDPARLGLGSDVNLILEVGAGSDTAAAAALEDGLSPLIEDGTVETATVATSLAQRDAMWLIREAADAMGRAYAVELWYDVSMPSGTIDAYLAGLAERLPAIDPALEMHAIGHLADGNLHVLVGRRHDPAPDKKAIEQAVHHGLAAVGGAFSAEHGIGLDKRAALARLSDPGKIAVMRRLKAALDPAGILNPGKVLPAG